MRSSQGFTLVEVVVALAVLGVALPALFYVLNSQAQQLSYLQKRMLSQWVAANELEKLRLRKRAGHALPESYVGVSQMGQQEWHWNMEKQSVTDNEMHRFIVSVDDGSGESVAALSLLLEP